MTAGTPKTARKDSPGLPEAVEGIRRILQVEKGPLEIAVSDPGQGPLVSVQLSPSEAAYVIKWLIGRHDIEAAMAMERLGLGDGPDAATRAAMAEVDGVERWFKTRDELFDALEAAE